MAFMNIYFFFYDLHDNFQKYLYNIFNNYIAYNFFSKSYINKNNSINSINSDNSNNSFHEFSYQDLDENNVQDNNYDYIVCKKCKIIINNEIYLFNDNYFCSKFCRKHYSYKI